ncbi:hypothetical protein I2I11_04145 [Pontibacter sp. 172403-2]|uniref:hypothetical protein n=1 Tax=Pontibacter rufus TaxID=2791028 RepID=UPI0018AFDBD3|nr:hypothetical protein [Pontibacter sp. 172403-2]MBF9252475.1 hypothetical protein [Pontibacter sp. 172403-2]
MPKEKIKIEFSEEDLKELIAEKYSLELNTVYLSISHYKGDAREPAYTTVFAEGEKKQ